MSRSNLSTYDSAMLSDEGDLYSDEDDGSFNGEIRTNALGEKIIPSAADRRAHHNALERKRRDHIKDSFTSLRDSVPSLQGEKVTVNSASRAQILKKAAEYIQYMRKKNTNVQTDIDEIAKQNKMLEEQIRRLEKVKPGGVDGGMTNSALSTLYSTSSDPTDVSTSYDISENSNASSNSGLGGAAAPSVVVGGVAVANPPGPTSLPSAVSIISTADHSNNHNIKSNGNHHGPTTVRNGAVSMRPVTVKNGTTSKIIVQNPQHKSTPHVIHVTTTPGGSAANGAVSNISAMSTNGTPIIISTTLSSPSSSVSMGAVNGTNNGYVINKGAGALSLPNGFRTLVVQQQPQATGATPTAVTTTPNIHILGTIPASANNYSKPPMKKLKISTDSDSIISPGGGSNGAGVTSVSS